MKILVVGAGGIGGFYGAQLHQVGADITFLLRGKRKQLIDEKGLTIETPKNHFTIFPKTVLADQLEPIYDLIILAPKAFDLADSLNSISKASSHGMILPFLNGFTHLAVLDQQFGQNRVLGGVAHIAATITESGSVKQLNEMKTLTVGPRNQNQVAVCQDFFQLCNKADFDSFYRDDIELALWEKWVFLATLAGATTICRGSIGDIVATTYGKDLIQQMFHECCEIATSLGYTISDQARIKSLEILTKAGSPFTASMLRDLLAGNKNEHEHILGELINFAVKNSIECPLLKIAYTHMAVESRHQS